MRKQRQQTHLVDTLFIIILFFVFCICALSVIVIGANVYQTTTKNMNDNFTTKTALSYLVEKVRQNDTKGTLEAVDWNGTNALRFRQESNEAVYVTYIYAYDGNLKELFVKEGVACSPQDGQTIMAVRDFQIEQNPGNLYRITITDEKGHSDSVSVTERSLQ